MGCPEQVPASYIEIRMATKYADFKCHFCQRLKPAGSIAIEYIRNGKTIALACIWHKLCKSFEDTGMLCKNHEDRLDVECSEIPF